MRKSLFILFVLFNLVGLSFAQNFVSSNVNDKIYDIIDYAQMNGLCNSLSGYKPYTQQQILISIDEILNSDLELSDTALNIIEDYKDEYLFNEYKSNNVLHAFIQTKEDSKVRASLDYNFGWETIVSGGIYNKINYSQWGMDNIASFHFMGDIGDNFSYYFNPYFDLTRMPLTYAGEYIISRDEQYDGPKYIYKPKYNELADGTKEIIGYEFVENLNRTRSVKKFLNLSYLPYSYNKHWDGQMYYLSNLSSDGLEGWPQEIGVSGGVMAEIRASFLDNKLVFGAGRYAREIAGMDNGSSLVLNSRARPFFGIDMTATPFDFLKFTTLTGALEYPNQDYMNLNAMPKYDEFVGKYPAYNSKGELILDDNKNPVYLPVYYPRSYDDAIYWQNLVSINMIELDFKYLHFDFGGTVIWPKRLDFGYIFPLSVFVEYQNHIGDYDNLSLFADLKLRYPGLGELWGSVYIDEVNGVNNNLLVDTRQMYAIQAGIKYVVPKLDFATVGFRYSKVEPFCYTHHAVKTPWFDHPISQNYTNNGESLGYYLPPNSDEFLLTFDWLPLENMTFNFMFQFMRHGADYGKYQVPGSSLYSELSPSNRHLMHKYFLHDGAYNWIYNIALSSSYDFHKNNVPLKVFANLGFTYSYWTCIDAKLAEENSKNGYCEGIGYNTKYHKIDTLEYPTLFGGVLTVGVKISF